MLEYSEKEEKASNFALMTLAFLLFVFFAILLFTPSSQPSQVSTYETREEALAHCQDPVAIAGPLSDESRGWRCPE